MINTIENLPDLPRKLNKREAHITPAVLKWFRESNLGSSAIEIKCTNKDTIPEKALAPHQKQALLAAKGPGMTHKIADNRTRLPFDGFMLRGADAFVVGCFTRYGVCLVFNVEDWHGARYDDEALFRIEL